MSSDVPTGEAESLEVLKANEATMVLVKEFEMWESVISSLRSHSTYYVQEWCKSKLISVL